MSLLIFLLATCNLLNDNYNDLMKVAYERKVESKMIYTKLNADDDGLDMCVN